MACPRGDLQQSGVFPERLRGNEVNAVLLLVGLAFARVELKLHRVLNLYLFSAVEAPPVPFHDHQGITAMGFSVLHKYVSGTLQDCAALH